jgi:hypothetical protein
MDSDPIQNATPHISKWNLARMEEFCLKRSTSQLFSHDMAPLDFFLFGWLKGELTSLPVTEINELFHVVKEFWALSGSRQSPTIFRTESKDWNKLLISMVITSHTDLSKCKTIILTQLFVGYDNDFLDT